MTERYTLHVARPRNSFYEDRTEVAVESYQDAVKVAVDAWRATRRTVRLVGGIGLESLHYIKKDGSFRDINAPGGKPVTGTHA